MFPTQNLHVKEMARLITPRALKEEFPISEASNQTVVGWFHTPHRFDKESTIRRPE